MMVGIQRVLGGIGAVVRARLSFTLQLVALIWGVVREAAFASTWRRTVRGMFRRTLTAIVGGSLGTVVVIGVVVGLGLVFEALYWLRAAGQDDQIGRILVLVLIREITPLLIGIVVLGRTGLATVAEIGMLQVEGEVNVMRAEGLDIFQLLVLPRAMAFAIGTFTLGVMFVLVALVSGFLTGSLAGVVNVSIFSFLNDVLRSMNAQDFVVFPLKLALIGLVVAGVCCLTGLAARPYEASSMVLPRGFTRGITSILLVTIGVSVLL